MAITNEVMPVEKGVPSDSTSAHVLIGAVLLLGLWAALTGNLDMGWTSSMLLIGP